MQTAEAMVSRPIYTYDEMCGQAKRIEHFWKKRGVHIDWRVEMAGKQWTIRSSLTGREQCERIDVLPQFRGRVAA